MTLHHLVFNPYEVNTYIIAAADGQCAIVDPACCSSGEQAALEKYIADKNLHPVWLINTHGHFDHVIGNAFVCHTWPVKTAAHRGDLFLMENAYRQGEIFGFTVEQPPTPEIFLDEGDTVAFGDDVSLQIRHIPGHSPGSIVLYAPDRKWIIVGDVLFNGSIGRSDLPGGDYDLLINGIEEKLMTLPMNTVVHPGHGADTSIGQERIHNPFLNGM
ncbi:MAG: MBL fold metallo-hydrolase [Bacteroidales bacterium]|jgi:glyoxylase-like metal-dependent hydrolase (beta-lactamase superfamily II)|nr:MBL fold metallo-hydrolase [Bacteroidales bacterium]